MILPANGAASAAMRVATPVQPVILDGLQVFRVAICMEDWLNNESLPDAQPLQQDLVTGRALPSERSSVCIQDLCNHIIGTPHLRWLSLVFADFDEDAVLTLVAGMLLTIESGAPFDILDLAEYHTAQSRQHDR